MIIIRKTIFLWFRACIEDHDLFIGFVEMQKTGSRFKKYCNVQKS